MGQYRGGPGHSGRRHRPGTRSATALLVPTAGASTACDWRVPAKEADPIPRTARYSPPAPPVDRVVDRQDLFERRGRSHRFVDPHRWVEFDPAAPRPEWGGPTFEAAPVVIPEDTSHRGPRRIAGIVLAIAIVAAVGVGMSVVASHASVLPHSATSGRASSGAVGPSAGRPSRSRRTRSARGSDLTGGRGSAANPPPGGRSGDRVRRRHGLLVAAGGSAIGRTAGGPVECVGGTAPSATACARREATQARRAEHQATVSARLQERAADLGRSHSEGSLPSRS
jgi:hypothetical protein